MQEGDGDGDATPLSLLAGCVVAGSSGQGRTVLAAQQVAAAAAAAAAAQLPDASTVCFHIIRNLETMHELYLIVNTFYNRALRSIWKLTRSMEC